MIRILLLILMSFSVQAAAKDKSKGVDKNGVTQLTYQLSPQMLLIGGGLKVCSSYVQTHCLQPLRKAELMKPSLRTGNDLVVTSGTIKEIQKDNHHLFPEKHMLNQLSDRLAEYLEQHGSDPVDIDTFYLRMNRLEKGEQEGFEDILSELNQRQRQFIKQSLQAPLESKDGAVLTEKAYVNNSDKDSATIIRKAQQLSQAIADSKGKDKARILVLTSSSSDPFDAVSFYLNLFANEKIETAWLPLEPAFLDVTHSDSLRCEDIETVRAKNQQQYFRRRVYPLLSQYQLAFCHKPELLNELILSADALFINGGDQTLTLQSLVKDKARSREYSPYFGLIKKQFEAGELLIMGTSAGTAVQSGNHEDGNDLPMISNGESLRGGYEGAVPALVPPAANCTEESSCPKGLQASSLTYNPRGGLGLVSLGVFDTHFSERERLVRLSRLLLDTQSSLGIGIDENTALHLTKISGQYQYSVYGQGATWFVDSSQAKLRQSPNRITMENLSIAVMRQKDKNIWNEREMMQEAFKGVECETKLKLDCQLVTGDGKYPLVLQVISSDYMLSDMLSDTLTDDVTSINLTIELSY